MSQEKAKEHSELVWGIIADAFKHSNADSASIPSSKSLLDFFREKLKEKDIEDESKKLVLQMCRIWGDFVGDVIEKQSLKYFWLEECIDGGSLLRFFPFPSNQTYLTVSRKPLRRLDLRLHPLPRCQTRPSKSKPLPFHPRNLDNFHHLPNW